MFSFVGAHMMHIIGAYQEMVLSLSSLGCVCRHNAVNQSCWFQRELFFIIVGIIIGVAIFLSSSKQSLFFLNKSEVLMFKQSQLHDLFPVGRSILELFPTYHYIIGIICIILIITIIIISYCPARHWAIMTVDLTPAWKRRRIWLFRGQSYPALLHLYCDICAG